MWSIRKGSWKQQTKKNNDLKGKWNYFFHISIVFSAGFCCQCSMLTVHLWWILQDVSALFLYRACCTNISCFILWLTRKQSIFSILEFPCYRKALAMLLTLTAGLLSKEKNNHKRHNLKSWWLGKHLSAGEQTATQHQHSPLSDSLSVHSWFTLLLLFHLTWRELPGETMLLPVLVACWQMCFHLPCESSFVFMGTNLYLDGLVSPEPHHNAISVNFRNISQSSG